MGQQEVLNELKKVDYCFISDLKTKLNQSNAINANLIRLRKSRDINMFLCKKQGNIYKYAYCLLKNKNKTIKQLNKIFDRVEYIKYEKTPKNY